MRYNLSFRGAAGDTGSASRTILRDEESAFSWKLQMSANIQGIQNDLRNAKLDGWLFYDFRGRDPIAQNILQLPNGMRTRRWYYFVPAKGEPKKLVHKIESESLAALPGDTLYYGAQDLLQNIVKRVLGGGENEARQYSAMKGGQCVA